MSRRRTLSRLRELRAHSKRGAALLLVIAVIIALVAIATPFALSMRLHERSARSYAARARARRLAGGARNIAVRTAMDSHASRERADPTDPNADDVDTIAEFEPEPQDFTGLTTMTFNDPRGEMYRVEVKDEQGKLDLNTASPFAIAGLLGMTNLTAGVRYEEQNELPVQSTLDFYSDGNPATIDGVLRVGGEYIAYRHTTETAFQGLIRGLYLSRPMKLDDGAEGNDTEDKVHFKEGTLVCDARAWKIAGHPFWSVLGTVRDGRLNDFRTLSSIKTIADWDHGALVLGLTLMRYGVTLDELRAMNLTGPLKQLGIDPSSYERLPREESEDEAVKRADAEKAVEGAGFNLGELQGLGKGMIEGIARRLERTNDRNRDKVVEQMRQRVAMQLSRQKRVQEWLQGELPRSMKDVMTLNSEAPDIETIGRIEFEDLRPFVTTSSVALAGRWTDWQVVLNDVRYDPSQFTTTLRVQDTTHALGGAICVIQPIGSATGDPIIRRVWRTTRNAIVVVPRLTRDYENRTLQVQVRRPAPVNINTAPRKVLQAAFSGVRLRGAQDGVTPVEARQIAEAVIRRVEGERMPFRGHEDFATWLLQQASSGKFSPNDALAIVVNGINPSDRRVLIHTVPFCFRTNDVYTIESTGIVNGPAGRELGRHSAREVVQVAPPSRLLHSWDSQFDLEATLGLNTQRIARPNRYSNLLRSSPANLLAGGMPDRSHDPNAGDIRLRTGKVLDARGQGVAVQHFDAELMGAALPQDVQVGFVTRDYVPHPTVPAAVVTTIGAGHIEAWLRFDQRPTSGEIILLDIGQEQTQNRLVALYDASAGELVVRCYDETLDIRESEQMGLPGRRAIEVRGTFAPRRLNWYHLAIQWRGGLYGDLAAFVDGRFVATTESQVTFLSGDVDASTTTIPVEDASGFPARGVIRVGGWIDAAGRLRGGELMEYRRRTGSTFEVLSIQQRCDELGILPKTINGAPPANINGTRVATREITGSQANITARTTATWVRGEQNVVIGRVGLAHGRGTPVVVHGYRTALGWARVPVPDPANPGQTITVNRAETLPVGGASLALPLTERTPFTLLYAPVTQTTDASGNPLGLSGLIAQPALLATETVQMTTVWAGAYPDGANPAGGFPTRGILQLGRGQNAEFVGYSGLNPQTGAFLNLTRGLFGSAVVDHSNFTPVTLVSMVFGGSLNDYPSTGTLALTQDERTFEWVRYRKTADPGYQDMLVFSSVNPGSFTGLVTPPNKRSWLSPLLKMFVDRSGRLPPNVGQMAFDGQYSDGSGNVQSESLPLKEWLKREEPAANSRARGQTGIGSRLGFLRGPGRELARGSRALPTVTVEQIGLNRLPGPTDIVTLTDDGTPPQREERMVLHRAPNGNRIAFDDFVSRPLEAIRGGRLAKWPTGLLPPALVAGNPTTPRLGAPSAKIVQDPNSPELPLGGRVDEIRALPLRQNPPVNVLPERLNAGDASSPRLRQGRNNPPPYLVKIGPEIIAVTEPESGTLMRGVLGTPAVDHGPQSPVWRLEWPAVTLAESSFQGSLGRDVALHRGGRGFSPQDGYVAVDRGGGEGFLDVIAYERLGGTRLRRPDDRFGRGVFEHSFGSGGRGRIGAGDLLVGLPFRFHDRYEDNRTSLKGTYLQFSRTFEGAFFESIEWDVLHPNPYTQIVVRVRVDGKPAFDRPRVKDPRTRGGLFIFKDPPVVSRVVARPGDDKSRKLGVSGDQIDIQVWLTYQPGAFFNDGWKQTPIVSAIRLKYFQPTQVRSHEETRE